jgi:transcriptional regulator GlxA family with amidase domain
MRRVVIVAFDGLQPLDVVGPHEVFAVATDTLAQRRSQRAGYTLELAAPKPGLLRGEGGLGLHAGTSLARLGGDRAVDTLVVAGGLGARRAATDPRIVQQIRRAAGRARRVASVCTGAFLLAAAGLLDGRRATTHWAYADRLRALRPAVQVDPDPIYVRDGRLWTSAGVTAGIDLALAMVEEDLGREIASEVARALVVFVRRAGGQSQFSAQLEAQAAARAPIRDLQALIAEHPAADLEVPALARRAAMSVRHFARVFRAEVGLTPATYVEKVRLETARRLLETTALPVEGVAAAAGFGTPESLRRTLARRVGLSPREYRARFGARPPAPDAPARPKRPRRKPP